MQELPDRPVSKKFETTGASTIGECWVDCNGSFVILANDGQPLIIPANLRRLVAKYLREMTYVRVP